jgi:hydrogenase nickel incorporation protein HypA/HybF
LPLTRNIFEIALKAAEQNHAARIITVRIKVGAMRDFVEKVTQKYWDYISEGTIGAGAKIHFDRIPVTASCRSCHQVFPCDWRSTGLIRCPACGNPGVDLLTGHELEVVEIAVI